MKALGPVVHRINVLLTGAQAGVALDLATKMSVTALSLTEPDEERAAAFAGDCKHLFDGSLLQLASGKDAKCFASGVVAKTRSIETTLDLIIGMVKTLPNDDVPTHMTVPLGITRSDDSLSLPRPLFDVLCHMESNLVQVAISIAYIKDAINKSDTKHILTDGFQLRQDLVTAFGIVDVSV